MLMKQTVSPLSFYHSLQTQQLNINFACELQFKYAENIPAVTAGPVIVHSNKLLELPT